MIVNLTNAGYEVIFQPAHGLLAAQLADHWRRSDRPPLWLEFLLAVAQHDSQQRAFRGRGHLTDAGAPRGFTVSKGEGEPSDLSQPRAAIQEAFFQGRFAALMVSLHVSALYREKAAEDEELAAFLAEQAERQARWRKELNLNKTDAERYYRLMLWCDRCSLILSQDQVPENGRRLEVEPLPGGEASFLFEEGGSIRVEPWPFEADAFSVYLETRELTDLAYPSDEALLEALRAAKVRYETWRLARPG